MHQVMHCASTSVWASFVQVSAFREVLQGGDVMLASHTGSGKTLAYMLPLVRPLRIPTYQHTVYLLPIDQRTEQIPCPTHLQGSSWYKS